MEAAATQPLPERCAGGGERSYGEAARRSLDPRETEKDRTGRGIDCLTKECLCPTEANRMLCIGNV